MTRLTLPSALLRLRSDEQLVAAFRQGSEDAFRVIHDRYRARLFAYTRQMLGGSRSDAEDALQDVFLRAYNALRADERPVVLKAWLYRVAHNRCIDHLRRPTPPPSDVFEMSRTPTPDPLAEAERRDDLRRLVADVQRLPEQQRSALLMREMEGLSYVDLAEALGTTVPAVKSLLVRARIGLVEAAEARDTACVEIRDDLTLSFGKGVRASALARKHMRECSGCSQYRKDLRAVQTGLTALAPPAHPLGLLAKLLGLGGSGAAAGGTAAAGGGAAVAGGGIVAGTTAKVAAVVCCAALTAGGAAEIGKRAGVTGTSHHAAAARHQASSGPASHAAHAATRNGVPPAAIAAVTRARRAAAAASAARAAAQRRAAAVAAAPLIPVRAGEEPISQHALAEEPMPTMVVAPVEKVPGTVTGGELAPETPSVTTSPSVSTAPQPTTTSDPEPAKEQAAVASPPATTGPTPTSTPTSSGQSTSSGSEASTSAPTATGGQPPSSEGATSAPAEG